LLRGRREAARIRRPHDVGDDEHAAVRQRRRHVRNSARFSPPSRWWIASEETMACGGSAKARQSRPARSKAATVSRSAIAPQVARVCSRIAAEPSSASIRQAGKHSSSARLNSPSPGHSSTSSAPSGGGGISSR